jgi:hypothetical protein
LRAVDDRLLLLAVCRMRRLTGGLEIAESRRRQNAVSRRKSWLGCRNGVGSVVMLVAGKELKRCNSC